MPSARFTSANAKEMAAKSAETRRKLREERAKAAQVPELPPLPSEALPGYLNERLVRVRAQLDRLDAMLLHAVDAQEIERLARAAGVLAEQERLLDGRPLPGSRKPGKEPGPQRRNVEPIEG